MLASPVLTAARGKHPTGHAVHCGGKKSSSRWCSRDARLLTRCTNLPVLVLLLSSAVGRQVCTARRLTVTLQNTWPRSTHGGPQGRQRSTIA